MNKYIKLSLFLVVTLLVSCTDIVEVDVPTVKPRLVIEASLDWEKGTDGNEQLIKLSTTSPYFDTTILDPVSGASVKVINDADGTEFVFVDQNNGNYTINTFVPVINQPYTLEIMYNNELYSASETLVPVVDMVVVQSKEQGFDEETLEVNVIFKDPVDVDNFYLLKFYEEGDLLSQLSDVSDEFTDGNLISVFYEKEENTDINQEEFAPGDIVDISFYGISERYFNYIRLLIELSSNDGDPFSTVPIELKGNCINKTNPDNYAYGYFRVTEVVKNKFTFE